MDQPADLRHVLREGRTWRYALVWLLAAWVLTFAGNGSHSLWDRDEPRFAEASRRMLVDGDWVVPKFHDANRYDKPILIYWLMATSMKHFGAYEFGARLPSAVAGGLCVLIVFLLARIMGLGLGGSSMAAAAMLFNPLILLESKAATADAVLCLTIVGAVFVHWSQRVWGFAWWRHGLFWVLVALSVLTKGPPGLLAIGSAVLGERLLILIGAVRRGEGAPLLRGLAAAGLRTLAGFSIFVVVALPWAWMAWLRTGGEFFEVAIGFHVVGRAQRAINHQGGMLLYYFPVLIGAFLVTLPVFLNAAVYSWRHRSLPLERFLLCWIVPPFVVISLVATKLPHYVVMFIPAVALLMGRWYDRLEDGGGEARVLRWPAIVQSLLAVAVGTGAPVAVWWVLGYWPAVIPTAVAGGILAAGGLAAGHTWWRRQFATSVKLACAGFAGFILVGLLWLLPSLEPLRASRPVVDWLRLNAPIDVHLMASHYTEPSLVFYWRGPMEMLGKNEWQQAYDRLARYGEPAALVISKERWETWTREHPPRLSSRVLVRHEGGYYQFQKGGFQPLVIVGNW